MAKDKRTKIEYINLHEPPMFKPVPPPKGYKGETYPSGVEQKDIDKSLEERESGREDRIINETRGHRQGLRGVTKADKATLKAQKGK